MTSSIAYDADGTGTRRLPQGAAGETPPETATDTSQGREVTPEGEPKNEAPTRAYSDSRPASIVSSAAKRRNRTPLTLHHRYRIEHGVYPETMLPVVAELCDEIERLQQVVDELDGAFRRWRESHRKASRV